MVLHHLGSMLLLDLANQAVHIHRQLQAASRCCCRCRRARRQARVLLFRGVGQLALHCRQFVPQRRHSVLRTGRQGAPGEGWGKLAGRAGHQGHYAGASQTAAVLSKGFGCGAQPQLRPAPRRTRCSGSWHLTYW